MKASDVLRQVYSAYETGDRQLVEAPTRFGGRSRGLFKWRRGARRLFAVRRSFGRGTAGVRVLRFESPEERFGKAL
jgi:hypothetical protein